MIVFFYKTGKLDGRSYAKMQLRGSAIVNIEDDDKYCFLRSILACLHPHIKNHPNRVSNYRQ